MAIAAPNLDDRRFQDLVDDAKRMVMDRCPAWTDHNVSDPGFTLIETFAYVTDQLLYRLNRVPDRLYIKFLELIGIRLFPPTAARAGVTFWLSAPATTTLVIPAGTRTATLRGDGDEPVVFSTLRDLAIVPTELQTVATRANDVDGMRPRSEALAVGTAVPAFSEIPVPGDMLLIGLDRAAPGNAVAFHVDCEIDGVGVDPTDPPLAWEAWNGIDWEKCELEKDETGGLNRKGDIIVHLPAGHAESLIEGERAGWVRAQVIEAHEGQPRYSSSPLIRGLAVMTVGGTADSSHAEVAGPEHVGESSGQPGQRFRLDSGALVATGQTPIIEVSSDDGWEEWALVDSFADCGPGDKVVILDAAAGELEFAPLLRLEDGSIRSYGAIPPARTSIRVRDHAVGGGNRGNVAGRSIRTLKSSIPFVRGVTNRHPASGGVDAESVDEARVRGPLMLRTRSRAVTAEDFELLTREAAPEVARVRCIPAQTAEDAGHVTVCIVPAAARENDILRFEDLLPTEPTLAAIAERLEDSRIIGSVVHVEPPTYQGVTVVARLRSTPRADPERVRSEATAALHRYFDPLVGGPNGKGWPWGRPAQAGDAFSVLQRIAGVDVVEDVRLFGANPVTGERGEATARLELAANSLVFSYEHQVRVVTP
ncbi:MAG TPA: putative baseplate assembly protein [Ilumatobacter sp.]